MIRGSLIKLMFGVISALVLAPSLVPLVRAGSVETASQELTQLRADLEFIASVERGGRAPGSKGSWLTRAYISSSLGDHGCQPAGDEGKWFQAVAAPTEGAFPEVHLPEGAEWKSVSLINVVGILPGSTPIPESGQERQVVVIGAHFDHLGEVDGTVYTGADDNASGVAVLLQVARVLAESGPFRNDIVFLAFDGEEAGRQGSRHYVAHPAVPLERTVAMINLDTIGRMQDTRLFALAAGTAREFPEILRGVNLGFGFDLATPKEGSLASDHLSFIEHGVPALHLSTGANADYHRPSDTAEKIRFNELAKTADFVVELVSFLADETDPLSFVPPGAEQMAAPAAGSQPRRVSLGTIPDFAREAGGVLLTGVMPGSPAEKAGLQKGDIVISLAGTPIDNLADLSGVLKAHQPGDEVAVEIMRGDEKVVETVTLVERSTR